MSIKILQINIDRRRNALDLANNMALRNDVDIIMIQEPNMATQRDKRWIIDKDGVVAIRQTGGVGSIHIHVGKVLLV